MSEEKNKPINEELNKKEADSGETGESGQSTIAFHDFLGTGKDINIVMNDMRQALLGVAEVETDILKNIKEHLDHMLDNVYQHVHDYQLTTTLDSMVSDQPMTTADPAIVQGLDGINQNLNDKNAAITKLQNELNLLGAGVFADGMSADMLRQQLEELNNRNKVLRKIHGELRKHPMITGHVPKDMTMKEIKGMLENLNEQIRQLNQTNADLKAQLKQQKLQTKTQRMDNQPDEPAPPSSSSSFRRRH